MSLQLPSVLKAFSVFVDGRGYAGRADAVTLPKLTLKIEEHRGGGMDAPIQIDQGMEKLEATLTFAEHSGDLIALFSRPDTQITARGSIEDQAGGSIPIIATLRGTFKEADLGEWKAGEKGALKLSAAVDYYRLIIGGRERVLIDVMGAVRRIDGADALAGRRAALGL